MKRLLRESGLPSIALARREPLVDQVVRETTAWQLFTLQRAVTVLVNAHADPNATPAFSSLTRGRAAVMTT